MQQWTRKQRLRIGIINLMPRVQHYEPYLLRPLTQAEVPFEPAWIRLHSQTYATRDAAHLEQCYQSFDQAGALDGLIVTGAPVEELEFATIPYWPELAHILDLARACALPCLGLCWGGLALAFQLGVRKTNFEHKLFGVFELRRLEPEHPLFRESDDVFVCPQSRHSGISDAELEAAVSDGRVRALAHSSAAGYSIFESADGRSVMHLGHPEYDAERLVYEYGRDLAANRFDVRAPVALDLERPVTRWRSHRNDFFRQWLRAICATNDARVDSTG